MQVLVSNVKTRVLQLRKVLNLPFYTPTNPWQASSVFFYGTTKCWSIIELPGPDLLTSEPAKKISQDV